jgi:hypothetical protein
MIFKIEKIVEAETSSLNSTVFWLNFGKIVKIDTKKKKKKKKNWLTTTWKKGEKKEKSDN